MISSTRNVLCLLLLALALAFACQKNEQASVQPEKLASSSPAASVASGVGSGQSAAGGALPGPLVPYAEGRHVGGGAPLAEGSAPSPDLEPGSSAAPATTGTAAAAGTVNPNAPVVSMSDVTLLEAGAKPHRKLRLHPKVGQVGMMEMTLAMAFDMTVDGKKQPLGKMPPMVMTMKTRVAAIEPNSGDIRYQFTLTGTGVKSAPGVQPEVKKAMGQALGALKGMTGTVLVSDRGITRDTKISLPGASNAQTQQVLQGMEQAMQQLGAPLPKEPVGIGGRWQYTTKVSQNGITLTQTATYKLTKLKGDRLTCKVKLTQKAPKQKVQSPIGVAVDLLSLKSSGGGKTRMRLDLLTPIKSTLELKSKILMGMPKGQKMQMKSQMTVKVRRP